MAAPTPGYRFLRAVLIIGGTGFGLLGLFYLISGQWVPGLFALIVAAAEFAALPLFRRLFAMHQPGSAAEAEKGGKSGDQS